jgi:hypothetical protein
MDEKGFTKGIGDDVEMLVTVTKEEVFSIHPNNRERVSVVECIGINNYHLPVSIFQGRRVQEFWINHRIDKQTALYISENG